MMDQTLRLEAMSERLPASGGQIQGGSLLTGGPGLTPLLVRETVQNAWDARDPGLGDHPVHYEIHGFDLDERERNHLRALLPVDNLGGYARTSSSVNVSGLLHPHAAISAATVKVLVISDRNTVGLCGPSRSGVRWDPIRYGQPLPHGQPRFANFVRNMGRATKDIGQGDGGSYGVGKSALWMASSCGTILIHTKTTDEFGNPVERFIGSIHGEHFYQGEVAYTGRHFVGRRVGDDLIEPLEGEEAVLAAKGLPIPPYEADGIPTYGTSIVIVSPRFTLDWKTEMERIRDAVRWHVWPKRVAGIRREGCGPDMEIRVKWNRNEVLLPAPAEDPEIRPYVRALEHCATDRRDESDNRDFSPRCRNPLKDLGLLKFRTAGPSDNNVFHVTLSEAELAARSAGDQASGLIDVEPVVEFERPWGQVALIRREPLLLVRYQQIGGPDAAATEVGVFLSADDPEVEAALTKAEPPAHDDWDPRNVPQDGPTDHRRRFAKRTVEEIRAGITSLLEEFRLPATASAGSSEVSLAAELSRALLGGGGGTGGKKRGERNSTSRSQPSPGPRAELRLVRSEQAGEQTTHELEVSLQGLGSNAVSALLRASGNGLDSAGLMSVERRVTFTWHLADDTWVDGPEVTLLGRDTGQLATLLIAVTGSLRVRPHVDVSVITLDEVLGANHGEGVGDHD